MASEASMFKGEIGPATTFLKSIQLISYGFFSVLFMDSDHWVS
jgi:hypothetical protein